MDFFSGLILFVLIASTLQPLLQARRAAESLASADNPLDLHQPQTGITQVSSPRPFARERITSGRFQFPRNMKMQDQHSKTHAQIAWAKERLDEIDATLTAAESKMNSLKAETRTKVEQAVAKMRAQRDAFRQAVNANREATENAWRDLRTKLETQWTTFEHSFQEWAQATHDQIEQQKAVFTARAEAQIKALNESVKHFQTSAKEFSEARKTEIDAAFKVARTQADAAKAQAQAMRQAGKDALAALNKSLAESRAAFDKANKAAHDQTGRAA